MNCPVCGWEVRNKKQLWVHQLQFHWKKMFPQEQKSTKKWLDKK